MNKPTIVPEKINKPIQLLGAWLAGLFSVDSCFLFAASRMESGSTESVALVIAAIANVPLFLIAVFLLQTRYRPELQEDSYYSTYLSQKTNEPIYIKKEDGKLAELSQKIATLEVLVSSQKQPASGQELLAGILFGVNEFLPNREEIKALLRQKGVLGVSSFGNKDLPRPKFAVAISEYLPKQVQNHVIEIAKEVGATHYSFFDNHKEETEEEVLFGGYNADQFEIA